MDFFVAHKYVVNRLGCTATLSTIEFSNSTAEYFPEFREQYSSIYLSECAGWFMLSDYVESVVWLPLPRHEFSVV